MPQAETGIGGQILDRLDGLARLFESKLAYDAFKEGQISRLHSELQDYKSDLLARVAMPLIQGIIRLHDDLGKVLDAAGPESTNLSGERLIRSMEAFREDLEILLADSGVTAYQVPDEGFDPRRQRALRTVSSSDTSLAGRVAARLRPGFERGDSIVVKERVAVYVASPPEDTASTEKSDGNPIVPPGSERAGSAPQ